MIEKLHKHNPATSTSVDSNLTETSIKINQPVEDPPTRREIYAYYITFAVLIFTMAIIITGNRLHIIVEEPHQSIVINSYIQKDPQLPVVVEISPQISCDELRNQARETLNNFFNDFPSIEDFDANLKFTDKINADFALTYKILQKVQKVTDEMAKILKISSDDVGEFLRDGAMGGEYPLVLVCFVDDFKGILQVANEAISIIKKSDVKTGEIGENFKNNKNLKEEIAEMDYLIDKVNELEELSDGIYGFDYISGRENKSKSFNGENLIQFVETKENFDDKMDNYLEKDENILETPKTTDE